MARKELTPDPTVTHQLNYSLQLRRAELEMSCALRHSHVPRLFAGEARAHPVEVVICSRGRVTDVVVRRETRTLQELPSFRCRILVEDVMREGSRDDGAELGEGFLGGCDSDWVEGVVSDGGRREEMEEERGVVVGDATQRTCQADECRHVEHA